MATKTIRKIVSIDEEKCDGCGACAIACAEGALKIIDGKARLISEQYCDGLGACLGECPQGAIKVEEREAEEFSEKAVEANLHHEEPALPCGCPGTAVRSFEEATPCCAPQSVVSRPASRLSNWPVQLALVPPGAPFLKGADLLLAADCTSFACAGFHDDYLRGRALLIACPKLDDLQAHVDRLTEILRTASPRSITVLHMEVPCCSGLTYMAKQAIKASGKTIPLDEITVGIRGDRKS